MRRVALYGSALLVGFLLAACQPDEPDLGFRGEIPLTGVLTYEP